MRRKTRRTTATRTEPNAETNVPDETSPNGAYGGSEVETSRGLGLSSLNINFCNKIDTNKCECAQVQTILTKLAQIKQLL